MPKCPKCGSDGNVKRLRTATNADLAGVAVGSLSSTAKCASLGAAIGSIVPGFGTAIGGALGALIGAAGGAAEGAALGAAGGAVTDKLLNRYHCHRCDYKFSA